MSIEEWDRTLRGMTKREYAAEKRKRKLRVIWECAVDIAGGFVLAVIGFSFAWLCCAASGYHWE